MKMSNSPLVEFTLISPNQSSRNGEKIRGIAIHCVVGQCDIENLGALFYNPNLEASSNYGIDRKGRVGMFVEESRRAWTTSSYYVDQKCVTIEVASDTFDPFRVNDAAYNKLLDLVEDICRRNGIKKLGWSWDEATRKAWAYGTDNGCNMQVHRDWAWKSCPGDYLYERHQAIADEVNRRLGAEPPKPEPVPEPVSEISAGDIVKIKQGATYINGRPIVDIILAEEWIVKTVNNNLNYAIIDRSTDGKWAINSAVDLKYLTKVEQKFKPYIVRVIADCLNIRSGPGTNFEVTGQIVDRGVYTIMEESSGDGASSWGKLRSGAGWVALDWTTKI